MASKKVKPVQSPKILTPATNFFLLLKAITTSLLLEYVLYIYYLVLYKKNQTII